MADLFGDSITSPSTSRQSSRNLAMGFAEFWAAWPIGPRKVAKKQCLDKWARYECADDWTRIVDHVEWMKCQSDWAKDGGAYIPQPMTYLNQQRWIEWTPPAAKTGPDIDPELARLRAESRMAKGVPANIRDRLRAASGRHNGA